MLLKKVDAVVVRVADIDVALDFYCEKLGQKLLWRKGDTAAVGLGESELVLSTKLDPETDILVDSVIEAIKTIKKAGGTIIVDPQDIDVGKVAVVEDPFGNRLTLVDLTKGLYQTDSSKNVTDVK